MRIYWYQRGQLVEIEVEHDFAKLKTPRWHKSQLHIQVFQMCLATVPYNPALYPDNF